MTQTILITGASTGIGKAAAELFLERGWNVVATMRTPRNEKHDPRWLELPLDVTDATSIDNAKARALEKFGRVDVVVNNAGYGLPGTFSSQPWSEHARFLQVMVGAVCELSHRFLPEMQRAGHGAILNVASLAGHVPGSAGHTLYAASKAFMIKFSQSLALENAARGIKVSALCPGFTYSEFHDVTGTRDQVSKMPKWMWMDAARVAREGVETFLLRYRGVSGRRRR